MEIQERDSRSEFLIKWYEILWSNINRSMEGIWKILAPITVVGTIILATQKGYVPLSLGAALVFIVLFWGLNLTIDLNNWHRRNLCLLTTVERELLRDADYGRIILARYRKPSYEWITFYKINFIALVILFAVCIIYFFWTSIQHEEIAWYFWLLVGIGMVATICNFIIHERSAKKRVEALFPE